jgi:Ni/Fe-hydrogenase 1 B-type cytochrome subunit
MPNVFERVYVWEMPVRILHWFHVASIFTLAITGIYIGHPFIGLAIGPQPTRLLVTDWMRAIHFVSAYVFGIGFFVRGYWLFAGNRYANWRGWIPVGRERWSFLWRQLRYYLFLDSDRPSYPGHNPVAGLTYTMLGVLIAAQGITGLALYSDPFPSGFWHVTFGQLNEFLGDQTLRAIHHGLMYLFVIFFVVHLYMAVLADIEERSGGITSIISGVKFEEFEEDQ